MRCLAQDELSRLLSRATTVLKAANLEQMTYRELKRILRAELSPEIVSRHHLVSLRGIQL